MIISPTSGRRIARFALLVLVAAAGSANFAAAADPLVWKFTAGDVERYRLTQALDTTMDLGEGGKHRSIVDQLIDMQWTVEKLTDGGAAVMSARIERLQLKVTGPDGTATQFDSAAKDPPEGFASMLGPLAKALTAEPFRFTLTPAGEVQDVEVPAAAVKAIKASPGADKLGELASEDGIRKLVQQSVLPLPKALESGSQWTSQAETRNPVFGVLTAATTYRYEGQQQVEGRTLEAIAVELELSYATDAEAAKIDVESQESSGTILFDRSAGRMESSTVEHTMTLKITAPGQEVTQELQQKTKVVRIADEE